MKMAKPSTRDIEAAGDLLSLLLAVDRGDYPSTDDESQPVPDYFDEDDPEHLRALYDAIKATLDKGPGYPGRVLGGMLYVIMFDKNEIIDPDSDTLDLHPKLVAALAAPEPQATAPVTPKHIEEIKDILLWPVTEDDARTARDMLQSLHFDLSMAQDAAPQASAQPAADVCAEMRALCSYCGGTGDVHGIDGEWRGACNCEASAWTRQPVGDIRAWAGENAPATAPIPENADQAVAMLNIAHMWLTDNAPDRLAATMPSHPTVPEEKPFMWAIMGPYGKPHMDEHCVSPDADDLSEVVFYLNDEQHTGHYKVVPVYTRPSAPSPLLGDAT